MERSRIVSTIGNETQALPELGAVLCKNCGELLGTLPTNGVKKLYSYCSDGCSTETAGGLAEDI